MKNDKDTIDENKEIKDSVHSSEMLEEILELSRDNQKLLKTPDDRLYDDLRKVREYVEQISMRNEMLNERKRVNRKYSSAILDEIVHMNGKRSSYGFLMTLSLFNDDFPWIYDMGKELMDILKNANSREDKSLAIRDFREMIDFTFSHPLMRETFANNRNSVMFMKELPYELMRYLDDFSEKYLEE